MTEVLMVGAGVVETAYERRGDPDGWPVVLLHAFSYDVRCHDDVASRLAAEGADVVVSYLRGHGPPAWSPLWPDRVGGLVTCSGYKRAGHRGVRGSAAAARRLRLRDQYYLHGERGRAGLRRGRLLPAPPSGTHEHQRHFSRLVDHRLAGRARRPAGESEGAHRRAARPAPRR
jgi:hypothetical protein